MAQADGLAMSWSDWGRHDAVGLAGLVRAGEIAPRALAAQVAAGTAKLNSQIEAVLELFADVLANPDADGPAKGGGSMACRCC